MKLLLTLIFSASLAAFSQVQSVTLPGHGSIIHRSELRATVGDVVKPDTLRAIILATMCRRCAAEAIRGYVVIEQGKRPVYLDCRKRALKGPQVGWGWREVNPNKKER